MASESDYTGHDIPVRLWTSGRRGHVISEQDRLYMRHAALDDGGPYAFQIPGHAKLEDQSVNSHRVNRFGTPRDVLFDTKRGNHYWDFQIACFNVRDIYTLQLPNQNSIQRKADGSLKKDADIFTFEIRHTPDEHMYPHCIIEAKKNGESVKDVPKTMRTAIRSQFAQIAERNRQTMLKFHQPGKPVKCHFRDRIVLTICKFLDKWRSRKFPYTD